MGNSCRGGSSFDFRPLVIARDQRFGDTSPCSSQAAAKAVLVDPDAHNGRDDPPTVRPCCRLALHPFTLRDDGFSVILVAEFSAVLCGAERSAFDLLGATMRTFVRPFPEEVFAVGTAIGFVPHVSEIPPVWLSVHPILLGSP